MNEDKIIPFSNPAESIVQDGLTEFLKNSAQRMLQVAVESEVEEFILSHQTLITEQKKQRVVRNGYLPERKIQTGIGGISVKVPRTRDQEESKRNPILFQSSLIPKYMRRTATLDVLLPLLYLKGISTKEIQTSLAPLLGENAESVSSSTISRLKAHWYQEFQKWNQRDLSKKSYVYWWADGIYLKSRMESAKTCILVIVGATEEGRKEIVAINDGFRESKESWKELLLSLQEQGLKKVPRLAVGDGALGFWGALSMLFPETQQQRCWVHKTVNLLDKLPKSQQPKAKSMIHEIYQSSNREDAEKAIHHFVKSYETKYPKVTQCLLKDQQSLLTFYNFPAEHWFHIRTTNPIESTFATVRHRTQLSKNCFSRETIIGSVFKLCQEAEKCWKFLRGRHRIAQIVQLEPFIDGIHEQEMDPLKNEKEQNAA